MLIFLGVEKSNRLSSSSQKEEGAREPPAWFAINTDEDAAELLKRCRENNSFFPKMPNRDLLKLNEEEAGEEDTVFLFFCLICLSHLSGGVDYNNRFYRTYIFMTYIF